MRKAAAWILLVVLSGFALHQWSAHGPQYRAAARTVRAGLLPCSSPVSYSIGAIDPRFGLTPEELAADLRDASAAWEKAAGRPLFELAASSGDLTVSMVYDKRQEALDKLRSIGLATDQSLGTYKGLKARYDELLAEVDQRRALLSAELAAYRAREAGYNAVVAGYNRRGSATRREAARLDADRYALERDFSGVKERESALNADIDLLNAMATMINQLIVELRLDAEQYRREGSALGSYEEGHYSVDGGFRAIEIYKYTGREQLTRLLAHELGHALGLDHVNDADALMYQLNRGGDLRLTAGDLAELDRACTSPLKRALRRK